MTATHLNAGSNSNSDSLPKSFVNSMRTLFDIMDDQQTGYVKLAEIERRWQEDGTQGLPRGVLESLRKVTPTDGYLSFERFCAGLQICLLRSKMADGVNYPSSLSSLNSDLQQNSSDPPSPQAPRRRPPSAPILDQDAPKQPRTNGIVGGTLRGGISMSHHQRAERTLSMPLLDEPQHIHNPSTRSVQQQYEHRDTHSYTMKPDIKMGVGIIKNHAKSSSIQGPPKPPRVLDRDRGTHSLDRLLDQRGSQDSQESRGTHSLEREYRSERRWEQERPGRERENTESITIRHNRGGSLERLLDGGADKQSQPLPLNRTGMRSALQTWYKERNPPETSQANYLKSSDTKNNPIYSNGTKHKTSQNYYERDFNKETTARHNGMGYSQTLESQAKRGVGDGGDVHRNSGDMHRNSGSEINRNGNNDLHRNNVNDMHRNGGDLHRNNGNELHRNGDLHRNNGNEIHRNGVDMHRNGDIHRNNGNELHRNNGNMASANSMEHQPLPPPQKDPTPHGIGWQPPPPHLPQQTIGIPHKKSNKRREPRRHTLQNGIDNNIIRRLRQLEAERDMLYQGLDVVERARVWYKQQLQSISDRIQYLPQGNSEPEPTIEAQQEKLHFQLARIHEVNAHLRALMEATDRGLPSHMNLAIVRGPPSVGLSGGTLNRPVNNGANKQSRSRQDQNGLSNENPPVVINQLKEQNHKLTEEVSAKSEKITSLEREKATLLRELFQSRAKQQLQLRPSGSNADSTFMV